MKLVYLFFLCFIIFSCDSNSNEDKIIESFTTYKDGFLQNNPDLSMSKLHPNTFDYFDDILFIIKEDDSIEVIKIPIYERFIVLLSRQILTVKRIKQINGKELYRLLITENIIDENRLFNVSLGEISVTENFALGEILINNKPSVFHYEFYQNDSEWLLDLCPQFELASEILNYSRKESGKTFNDLLVSMINLISTKPIDSTIWIPTDLR